MASEFKPPFEMIPSVRVAINVGGCFDIPAGSYEFGKHGESILNGGLTPVTGVVGAPNNFKTTIADFLGFTAYSRFKMHIHAGGMKYDTETNSTVSRHSQLAEHIEGLQGEDNPVENGRWNITDKTLYSGNAWFEIFRKYSKTKEEGAKDLKVVTPFLNRDGTNLEILVPTPACVDSLTELETDDVSEIRLNNELGDSGANTAFMRQGLAKTHLISQLPAIVAKGNIPTILTAHIGKTIAMDPRAAPVKTLQYLKNGDVIKGVTSKFLFLTHLCWQCSNAAPLMNDSTKAPEYPNGIGDDMKGDTDLTLVTLTLLRNKYGRSGLIMQVVVSQEEGVLPSLSEFHYIKTNERFGLGGNVQNYFLDLLPDVKLSRTTVRPKLYRDEKLRRAMNITSEMCQMRMLWNDDTNVFCTPKELYDDLIAIGYDWDTLLNTRGYWLANNDSPEHDKPFLSTMDLLRMRKGLYFPFFMNEDKSLKSEYRK